MKALSLSCNQCGASLTPPEDARYVTCSFCSARLQVVNEGNTHFTRVMEELRENTQQIAENLEIIKAQNELERLDREWTLEREKYLVKDKRGNSSEPSGFSIPGCLFLVLWIGMACFIAGKMGEVPGASGMALFPIGMIAIAVIAVLSSIGSHSKYAAAKEQYQQKRSQLIESLERAKR